MKGLHCGVNDIDIIPVLPYELDWLYCNNNPRLINLPKLPNTLSTLSCINCGLLELPENIMNIGYVCHTCVYGDSNPVSMLIKNNFNGNIEDYFKWKTKCYKIYADKISWWFLECKYNPKYKYCRDRLENEYEEALIF